LFPQIGNSDSKTLHIKELGPKGPRYLIMQHFSRPRNDNPS